MQKTYLYLMVCVIGAMSLASCSEDSISPDAGGDGDGDSTTEVPLAQVAKPKPNPWLAQEEYSITHFNSAQTDAFSSAVKDGTFNIDLSKCQMTWSGPVNLMTLASTSPNYMWGMSSARVSYLDISDGKLERVLPIQTSYLLLIVHAPELVVYTSLKRNIQTVHQSVFL